MDNLLCHEEMPMYSPISTKARHASDDLSIVVVNEDRELDLFVYSEKERFYAFDCRYADHVLSSPGLLSARFSAVQWILKSCGRFDFGLATAFNAVNYLDRFVSMRLFHVEWENWMIELISIACLSIAAKYDEVFFPSLIEIQSEDLDHSFESNTIQRMEMAVLEALDWRLSPVTAHYYVELLTWHLVSLNYAITARLTELLLASLSDPKFLEFRPSIVAVSALRCALEELTSSKCNEYATGLANFNSQEYKEMLEKCHKAMEETLIQDCSHNSHRRPSSPVTVIPSQRTVISDGCIDFHVLFEASNKKRKMDGPGGSF